MTTTKTTKSQRTSISKRKLAASAQEIEEVATAAAIAGEKEALHGAELVEEAEELAAALERLAGRKVHLTTAVDPALLGGAIARVGSMVYDGSLRTQLARLRRTMGEE